ncbi:MAG TPA: hypothetical protein QF761_12910 [Pirellulales bacterium]|nr:hypothetical protein [Pirellulales bacterium]
MERTTVPELTMRMETTMSAILTTALVFATLLTLDLLTAPRNC